MWSYRGLVPSPPESRSSFHWGPGHEATLRHSERSVSPGADPPAAQRVLSEHLLNVSTSFSEKKTHHHMSRNSPCEFFVTHTQFFSLSLFSKTYSVLVMSVRKNSTNPWFSGKPSGSNLQKSLQHFQVSGFLSAEDRSLVPFHPSLQMHLGGF